MPEALLSKLSLTTKVDYYAKVLHGKKMFYLLLYGILENEKLSQRTLEDTFNDVVFKTLSDLDKSESIRRSSISERPLMVYDRATLMFLKIKNMLVRTSLYLKLFWAMSNKS